MVVPTSAYNQESKGFLFLLQIRGVGTSEVKNPINLPNIQYQTWKPDMNTGHEVNFSPGWIPPKDPETQFFFQRDIWPLLASAWTQLTEVTLKYVQTDKLFRGNKIYLSLVFLPIKITLKWFLEGFIVRLLVSLTKNSFKNIFLCDFND